MALVLGAADAGAFGGFDNVLRSMEGGEQGGRKIVLDITLS